MTDFTPGPIITRDNPLCDVWPPSWLRGDVEVQQRDVTKGKWYGRPDGAIPFYGRDVSEDDDAIRLDASDIVYRCIEWNEAHPDEAPYFPHYGSEAAPEDFDSSQDVLLREGADMGVVGAFWRTDVIGYRKRRPTTSLPEPAEGIHTSGYAETIEESPEDFARAACKRAGMVAVKRITEDEAREHWARYNGTQTSWPDFIGVMRDLGLVAIPPSPLDLAKAAHPNISPEIVESIAAIVKGEMK